MAALKLRTEGEGLAVLAGSPRHHCRGRIEVMTMTVRGSKRPSVLHGFLAVAALKLGAEVLIGEDVVVLHGKDAVAALKEVHPPVEKA